MCENGIKREQIYSELSRAGLCGTALRSIVSDLVDRRLVVLLDDHFISVGIPKPLKEISKRYRDRPCGRIDHALYEALRLFGGGSAQGPVPRPNVFGGKA
jgi:hypothetical protein